MAIIVAASRNGKVTFQKSLKISKNVAHKDYLE